LFFSHCKFTKICWRKQITEQDFIGGQGSLTKEEEMALSKYFAKKGKAVVKNEKLTSTKKTQQLIQA
jgi:hypothetical protein